MISRYNIDIQARLKKREKVPFFLPSSTWAKSAVLGDAFAQRIWPLAGPLRRSFRAGPSQENSRQPKRVFVCGLHFHVDKTLTSARGGPAPRTPPRARSREPSFFFTIKSSGMYQDFPVQICPIFSPGLGLREVGVG